MNIFAFDFSMNKPAMTSFINGKVSFYVWCSEIDDKSKDILRLHDIKIVNRNIPPINKLDENHLILEHVTRATNLAKMIVQTMDDELEKNNITDKSEIIVSNEGFAFSSKGDATLDLSGYKYILMYTLIQNGYTNFRTYSPITIKKTAGCSKKGKKKSEEKKNSKVAMIEALSNEPENVHIFIDTVRNSPHLLKKKSAYVQCCDDIADSYWCLKTTLIKENIKSEITPDA